MVKAMEENIFNFLPRDILASVITLFTSKNLFFCLIGWLIYKLLFKPINYVKRLDEIGWLEDKMKSKTRLIGKIPPVYPNGWFLLAESKDLKRGKVMPVAALGENFVLFRTNKGEAKVLNAYCPHLGANMGVSGKVVGDCIQCPYHAWRFDGSTGECTYIPNIEKIPKSAKVKSWKIVERNGFIFVWYHAEDEVPSWYPEDIEEISMKKYKFFGRNEFYVKCHIQEVPENGSDISHFTAIHEASFLGGGDLLKSDTCWFKFFRHKWQASWAPSEMSGKQHIAEARIQHHITLFETIDIAKCNIRALQTGPGYVVLTVDTGFGNVVLLQAVTPVEPLLQKVIHTVYSPAYLLPYVRLFFIAECFMFQRDMMIWNSKTYFDQPLYTKDDKYIVKFRRWYQQFYSEHSKTYSRSKESLKW